MACRSAACCNEISTVASEPPHAPRLAISVNVGRLDVPNVERREHRDRSLVVGAEHMARREKLPTRWGNPMFDHRIRARADLFRIAAQPDHLAPVHDDELTATIDPAIERQAAVEADQMCSGHSLPAIAGTAAYHRLTAYAAQSGTKVDRACSIEASRDVRGR